MKSDFKRCFQLNLWVHVSPRSPRLREHLRFGEIEENHSPPALQPFINRAFFSRAFFTMLLVKVMNTINAEPFLTIAFSPPKTLRAFDDSTFWTIAFLHASTSILSQTAFLTLERPIVPI